MRTGKGLGPHQAVWLDWLCIVGDKAATKLMLRRLSGGGQGGQIPVHFATS